MGAPVWEKTRINLGEEGELVQLIQSWEEPTEQEASNESLPATLHHPSCGIVRWIRVSTAKAVIFCPQCGLRISIPAHISTVGQLKEIFQS